MTERRVRRPPVGVLLFLVVAGVAAVLSIASLRERPPRAPGGRRAAAQAAEEPVHRAPADAKKKSGKKKKAGKAAARPAKSDLQAIAVPSPAPTPAERKEAARRRKASAGIIAKSRSGKERQQLERHLRRFVGPRGAGRRGKEQYGVASTALALMAMLDFRDQDVRGLFEPSLAAAVHWLRKRQRKNGAFSGHRQLYENAIALMALAQAAESSGDGKLRAAVRKGLELFARRPGPLGGYRYGFGMPGDLSVTGWVAQAVDMARHAGVEIPRGLEPGLSEFLDSVWLGDHRFSYLSRNRGRKSLYPVGMLMAHILWPEPDPGVVAGWRRWLKQGVGTRLPSLYTLYYGVRVAIAMEKDLPDPWRKWVFGFARSQSRQGPAAGAFLRCNGRLLRCGKTLHTAVAVLTLEHALYLR